MSHAKLGEQILHFLTRHGQMLDSEIATATGISLKQIRAVMTDMSSRGVILSCNVTRFLDGKPVEALQYRLSGYQPPASPGRRPGSAAR